MERIDWLWYEGRYLAATVTILVGLLASGHAILRKRDPRSALLWVVVISLMPLIGVVLYFLLGVNRIERKATVLRSQDVRSQSVKFGFSCGSASDSPYEVAFQPLANLVNQLVPRTLQTGNHVEPLIDGEQAYPAMLEAIDGAQESIVLSTYIFERDGIGARFVAALGCAVARGVQVRVLIDDAGARLLRSSAAKALRKAQVPVGIFNPTLVPARLHAANLRNHSKILVTDGRLGFTGGLNIDTSYWGQDEDVNYNRDLHFRLQGPVVEHLSRVFAADWQFATGEALAGEIWFPALEPCGSMPARGIEDGPDENFERMRQVIHGALAVARTSVRILTPYFLPDASLISALNVTAMRGVEVDIILPEKTDQFYVKWAMAAQLWQVLNHGCRVWMTTGPFDHSKLMIVDGAWSLFGSANWDLRSLRLNFEFDVECYSEELGQQLEAIVESKRSDARRVTIEELDNRSLPVRLRDGSARLFAPFL